MGSIRGVADVNRAFSPAHIKAVVLLIVLLWPGQYTVVCAQRQSKGGSRKPQTSADNSFDPAKATKLAVIVEGNSRPRMTQTQTDQQRLVEDQFIEILIQKGYSLVSRSDIQSVMKEQQFQRSGLTEDNAAVPATY